MDLFFTALVAMATALVAIGSFTALELCRLPHPLSVILAAMAAASITVFLSWREQYEFEDDTAEVIANRRGEHRVPAWTNMPVAVFCRGERVETTVLNASVSGMALHWEAPHAAPRTLVRIQIPGYLDLPATVITEGGGFMRLRYTNDVPDKDRRRLRNDCVAGSWSIEDETEAALAGRASQG